MARPVVAIVGRANVGKSTFFNRLAGDRIAIVRDVPGVTRDRIVARAEWCGRTFTVIDTGGIEPTGDDPMRDAIRAQAEAAVATADVIVMFADGRAGLTAGDREIAELLRRARKPVLVAVNKLDTFDAAATYDFYELGLGEPYGISAEQGTGTGDLLDAVVAHFPPASAEEDESAVRIAVVGKPNAGKSSLVNRLLGEERVIVSDVAGTTRDAVDTPLTVDGEKYILVDTAGMRRKRGVESGSVEAVSALKAISSIERADVVLVVFDASEPLSEQDVRIAGYAHEAGKPSVIVYNKWDKIEKDTFTVQKYEADLAEALKFMDYRKVAYVSALTGRRTGSLIGLARAAYDNARRRLTTGTLNDLIADAVAVSEPPVKNGRRLKIYYATQASVAPPTFVVFVNDARLMHFSYVRYLENQLRRAVDFGGTPIRIEVRSRAEE